MTRNVECLSPDDSAAHAARCMRDTDVGFLPVCDSSRRVLGAVTDRDLALRVLASGRSGDTKVSDVMTSGVVSCRVDDDLSKAEQLMAERRVSRVLCVDSQDRLAGVISLSDIAKHDESRRLGDTVRSVKQTDVQC